MILPPSNSSQRRKGILIDWDLSRLEGELGTGPVEPDRTVCVPSDLCFVYKLISLFTLLGHLAIPLSLIASVPLEAIQA